MARRNETTASAEKIPIKTESTRKKRSSRNANSKGQRISPRRGVETGSEAAAVSAGLTGAVTVLPLRDCGLSGAVLRRARWENRSLPFALPPRKRSPSRFPGSRDHPMLCRGVTFQSCLLIVEFLDRALGRAG